MRDVSLNDEFADPVARIKPRAGNMFLRNAAQLSDLQIGLLEALSGAPTHVSRLIIEEPDEIRCVMVDDDGANSVDHGYLGLFDCHNPARCRLYFQPQTSRAYECGTGLVGGAAEAPRVQMLAGSTSPTRPRGSANSHLPPCQGNGPLSPITLLRVTTLQSAAAVLHSAFPIPTTARTVSRQAFEAFVITLARSLHTLEMRKSA